MGWQLAKSKVGKVGSKLGCSYSSRDASGKVGRSRVGFATVGGAFYRGAGITRQTTRATSPNPKPRLLSALPIRKRKGQQPSSCSSAPSRPNPFVSWPAATLLLVNLSSLDGLAVLAEPAHPVSDTIPAFLHRRGPSLPTQRRFPRASRLRGDITN